MSLLGKVGRPLKGISLPPNPATKIIDQHHQR